MPPNHSTFENCCDKHQAHYDDAGDHSDRFTASLPFPTTNTTSSEIVTNENPPQPASAGTSPVLRCAILGCGMMGQEHCSYIMGYAPHMMQLKYLCDPHVPSVQQCLHVIQEFSTESTSSSKKDIVLPQLVYSERKLFEHHLYDIDVLVIATPNYLHTASILLWGQYSHLTILVEKPVAVSKEQIQFLQQAQANHLIKANIWVAMEYRFIPAIAKLISLLHTIGTIKMITIRENRFPFLHKVDRWNRDRNKTGDTLVEKCCHFFDLMRLITGQEVNGSKIQSIVQRGLNYHDEEDVTTTTIPSMVTTAAKYGSSHNHTIHYNSGNDSDVDTSITDVPHPSALTSCDSSSEEDDYDDEENHENQFVPIIDSAYVTLPFQSKDKVKTIGCLELCMYADGSRHQEEVIVTGTKGRLEAYLPENKVYSYQRPTASQWTDRTKPPPFESIVRNVYDCSDVCSVHGIPTKTPPSSTDSKVSTPIPTHGGYHYSSTAIEWYRLLEAIHESKKSGIWKPLVSLQDGIAAVQIGLQATESIINYDD